MQGWPSKSKGRRAAILEEVPRPVRTVWRVSYRHRSTWKVRECPIGLLGKRRGVVCKKCFLSIQNQGRGAGSTALLILSLRCNPGNGNTFEHGRLYPGSSPPLDSVASPSCESCTILSRPTILAALQLEFCCFTVETRHVSPVQERTATEMSWLLLSSCEILLSSSGSAFERLKSNYSIKRYYETSNLGNQNFL